MPQALQRRSVPLRLLQLPRRGRGECSPAWRWLGLSAWRTIPQEASMLVEAGADELAQKVEERIEAKVLDNVRRRQWKRSSGGGGLLLAHQTGLRL